MAFQIHTPTPTSHRVSRMLASTVGSAGGWCEGVGVCGCLWEGGDILGTQGKATLLKEKEEEEGWWWCLWGLGGDKRAFVDGSYNVNPFLSALHTNNKKPA